MKQLTVAAHSDNVVVLYHYRPWYVEAVTPEVKDVVIILDTSRSMDVFISRTSTATYLYWAKLAAINVLDSLNPVDRVSTVLLYEQLA